MAGSVAAPRHYPHGFRVYTLRRLVLTIGAQVIYLPDSRAGREQACRLAHRLVREGRVVGIRVE